MNELEILLETIRLAEKHGMPDLPGSALGLEHLRSIADTAKAGSFSPATLGRWLGWAQCAVVASGVGVTLADIQKINERLLRNDEMGAAMLIPLDGRLNAPPVGICDRCGRKTWDSDELYTEDRMPQPNGNLCGGQFSAYR